MSDLRIQVRASDCDQNGHVNNAIYLDFLEHTFAANMASSGWSTDWDRNSECFWQLKSLAIEFRHPAEFEDELLASLWLDKYDEITPTFGFEIHLSDTDSGDNLPPTVARARSGWQRLDRESGKPLPISPRMLDGFANGGGSLPRVVSLPEDSPEFKRYQWDHKVMRSELAPSGKVHPRVILNWVEEAVFNASEKAGWPTERMLEAGFLTFQTRHDTEFFSSPGVEDRIRVVSRLVDVRRLRGTWLHEIYDRSHDVLLVRDYTSGVFLNRSGRPATPPPGLMQDVQYG